MQSIVSSFGLDRVDVCVMSNRSDSVDECGSEIHVSRYMLSDNNRQLESIHQDSLSKYCSHQERVRMGAIWAHGIGEVGQVFEGGAIEFRQILCKYAIEIGFQFKYIKNDSVRVTAVCSMRDSKDCMWRIHASIVKENGFMYIKSFENLHTCGAAVRTSKNPRMSSEIVGDVIVDQIRDEPLMKPIKVVQYLKKNYGLDISYHHAWHGVEKARKEIYGDNSLSFDQLRWYTKEAMRVNPGSHIVLDVNNEDNRFKRIFVAFEACIYGFNFIRPIVFLDGTFLKARYKGNLLAATGKDGDNGLFPLAYAVVDAENEYNWTWFCENLRHIISNDRGVTFVSDRNLGLLNAVGKVFPNSYHGFCLNHLKVNLREKFAGHNKALKERIVNTFVDCAYAPTKLKCEEYMDALKKDGGVKVEAFLLDIPRENWCSAYFKGQRYGEMYSNAAESFNSQIREARHLPITELVDRIRCQLMNQMSDRREICRSWNGVICPAMDKKLILAFNEGRTWVVSKASDTIYEVHSHPSVSVDLGARTCSCCKWQLNGFPCSHAVVVAQKSGKDLNILVDRFFHVSTYKDAYCKSIYPIVTVGKPVVAMEDVQILPPITRKQPGRPKKNRFPSRIEKFKSRIRCSRCGQMGNHNRKTCKVPM